MKQKSSNGRLINIIREHALQSEAFYIINGVVLIVMQTGLIFSEEISASYFNTIGNSEVMNNSMLSPDSWTNLLIKAVDIPSYLRVLAPAKIIALMLLCIFCLLFIALTLYMFEVINPLLKVVLTKRAQGIFFKSISVIVLNYDLIFFILNLVGVMSFPCRSIKVIENVSNKKNYLETGDVATYFFDELSRYEDLKWVVRSSCSLNDESLCLGSNHYIVAILGGLILGLNWIVKAASSKILRFAPSNRIFLSKYGDSDLFFEFILFGIIISKSVTMSFASKDYLILRLVSVIYTLILGLGYIINYLKSPYFHMFQYNLKSLQILYLLTLSIVSIILREVEISLLRSEFVTLTIMLLCVSLLVKLNNNVASENLEDLFREFSKVRDFNERRILQIYYVFMELLHEVLSTGENKNDSNLNHLNLFVMYFLKEHSKNCKLVNCFCRKSALYWENHPLGRFKIDTQHQFALELTCIMEEVLKKVVYPKEKRMEYGMYSYLYLLINYLGKPWIAYMHLAQKKKLNSYEEALLDSIWIIGNSNLETGHLVYHSYPQMQNENSSGIVIERNQISRFVKLLEYFEGTKMKINQCLELRLEFLEEIATSCDLYKAYRKSCDYSRILRNIERRFRFLNCQVGYNYSPVLLAHRIFLNDIYQKRYLANKLGVEYIKGYSRRDLNRIFGLSSQNTDNFCIISIENSALSTQEIKYASSNILEFLGNLDSKLGWRTKELERKDLDMIIPNPINCFHKELTKYKNITGKMLMNKERKKMVALKKNGFIIRFGLILRINTTWKGAFQFIGGMFFKGNEIYENLVLSNSEGDISALSTNAAEHFAIDAKIWDLNPYLKKVHKGLDSICSERLAKKDDLVDLDYIFGEHQMKNLSIYYHWKQSKRLKVICKDSKIVNCSMKITDYLLYPIAKYFLLIEVNFEDTIQSKIPRLGKMLKSSTKNINEDALCNIIFTRDEANDSLESRSESLHTIPEEKNQWIYNRRVFKTKSKRDMEQIQFDGMDVRKFKLAKNIVKLQAISTIAGKKLFVENKRREKQNRRLAIMNRGFDFSSRDSLKLKRFTQENLEILIHQNVDPYIIHPTTKIIGFIIFLSFLCSITGIWLRTPDQEKTGNEIKMQAITADYFSWMVWGQLFPVFYADLMRMIKEGWLPVDYAEDFTKYFGFRNFYDRSQSYFIRAAKYQYEPEKLIDMKIRNLTFPELFDYEGWITCKADIYVPETYKDTNEFIWKTVNVGRRSSIQFIAGIAQVFAKRIYENDTDIPIINQNRKIDVIEESYRINLNGDSNLKYYQYSLKFFKYLLAVGQLNKRNIFLTLIVTLTLLICLTIIAGVITLVDNCAMKRFYSALFDLKLQSVIVAKKKAESVRVISGQVLKDDRIMEENEKEYSCEDESIDKKVRITQMNYQSSSNALKNQNSQPNMLASSNLIKDEKGLSFGLLPPLVYMLVSIALLSLIYICFFFLILPGSIKQLSMIETYTLIIETWNSYFSIHASMLQTLIWNNTSPMWSMSSLEVFEHQTKHIRENLLPNLTRTLDYDLGNFTQLYRQGMAYGNSCETIYPPAKYPKCSETLDGMLNSNYMNALKGMLQLFESIVEEWKSKRGDWKEVLKIFEKKSMMSFLAQNNFILTDFYYWGTLPLSNTMMSNIDNYNINLHIYSNFALGGIFVIYLGMSFFIIYPLVRAFRNYYSLFYILPFELIEQNFVMQHRIKKIEGRRLFYKV